MSVWARARVRGLPRARAQPVLSSSLLRASSLLLKRLRIHMHFRILEWKYKATVWYLHLHPLMLTWQAQRALPSLLPGAS